MRGPFFVAKTKDGTYRIVQEQPVEGSTKKDVVEVKDHWLNNVNRLYGKHGPYEHKFSSVRKFIDEQTKFTSGRRKQTSFNLLSYWPLCVLRTPPLDRYNAPGNKQKNDHFLTILANSTITDKNFDHEAGKCICEHIAVDDSSAAAGSSKKLTTGPQLLMAASSCAKASDFLFSIITRF